MSTPESNPRVARILRTRLGSTLAALGADAWRTIVAALVAVIIAANALAVVSGGKTHRAGVSGHRDPKRSDHS